MFHELKIPAVADRDFIHSSHIKSSCLTFHHPTASSSRS